MVGHSKKTTILVEFKMYGVVNEIFMALVFCDFPNCKKSQILLAMLYRPFGVPETTLTTNDIYH